MKEEDIAGIGYILTFFNDVEQLANSFAVYTSTLLSIKEQIPNLMDLGKTRTIPEELRISIINASNNLRMWVIRCQLKAEAMADLIPALKNDDLRPIYDQAVVSSIMNFKDAESYCFQIHRCYADGTLKDVLFNVNEYSKLLKNET